MYKLECFIYTLFIRQCIAILVTMHDSIYMIVCLLQFQFIFVNLSKISIVKISMIFLVYESFDVFSDDRLDVSFNLSQISHGIYF